MCLFLWEATANYVHFKSATFGYTGCLAAAFGAPCLVYPCAALSTSTQAVDIYVKIQNTSIAVLIMWLVDCMLAPEAASQKATRKLLQSLELSGAGFCACFQPKSKSSVPSPLRHRRTPEFEKLVKMSDREIDLNKRAIESAQRQPGTIRNLIDEAMKLGREAALEPRHSLDPWPDALFAQLVYFLYSLRADLNLLEHVVHGMRDASVLRKSGCSCTSALVGTSSFRK
eukprot:TRINITY_DN105471_c0_g1_i1.p1 TRINITY_DN105471_c0_g1~~TRINITY_DN105471_c0_g1_i1.p1  ORF type:complete len:235 (-),score=29.69 TRINITY_DN105471_c0_g1_i1:118-801(-)